MRQLPVLPVLVLALIALFGAFGACSPSPVPLPEPPIQVPTPPKEHQGAQTVVVIPVPVSGASVWVRSTLVRVTSLTLVGSDGGAPSSSDAVTLYGTNDNTVAVTSASNLGAFFGPTGPQNVGSAGFNVGGYEYLAVTRAGGTTTGLSFVIVGDDGNSSVTDGGTTVTVVIDGGTFTVNQGNPGDAGSPWYTTDLNTQADLVAVSAQLTAANGYLSLITPPANGVNIYPNDDAGITGPDGGAVTCKAINVPTGGVVNVDFVGGENSVQYTVVVPGQIPLQITRLHANNTTACPDAGAGCTCLF